MPESSRTPGGIAYDRVGPRGDVPVVLVHAGLADRRMWDHVVRGIAGARLVMWLDVARLPSMERPSEFADLLRDWLTAWRPPEPA